MFGVFYQLLKERSIYKKNGIYAKECEMLSRQKILVVASSPILFYRCIRQQNSNNSLDFNGLFYDQGQ
mgnify:CR=1 FL=1